MSQQQMPNPVELYSEAVKKTRVIIGGVKPEQLKGSTPCKEWDVKALIDHLVGGAGFFAASLEGAEPQPPSGGRAQAAYDEATSRVLAAAKKPGVLDKSYKTPFGQMPGYAFMMGAFMDTVIHGWDLAKATGQDAKLNDKHAAIIHQAFAPQMDGMRKAGVFGPPVEVPANASVQDKLLGMMGRKP
ncbi:MAG: TIGR03086 family metal-binding protein [Chloroflexi bacterium]|nr:TIGR03086 family metal-binding protein [Chloroflexota bacterium]